MADNGDGANATSSGKDIRNAVTDGPVTDPAAAIKVTFKTIANHAPSPSPRGFRKLRLFFSGAWAIISTVEMRLNQPSTAFVTANFYIDRVALNRVPRFFFFRFIDPGKSGNSNFGFYVVSVWAFARLFDHEAKKLTARVIFLRG